MENNTNNTNSSSTPPTYGAGTDPFPYIVGAYGVGTFLILGFALLILLERRHLRMLMSALKKSS